MTRTNEPKITARVVHTPMGGPTYHEYVRLKELGIHGTLTESDLYKYRMGRSAVFERDDVALEGRLYLRNEEGEYLDDSHATSDGDRYIVKAINGDDIQCPWDKVTSGLGVLNPIYDHWDIYLRTGDKLTFLDGKESLKRYEVTLKNIRRPPTSLT